MKYLRLAIPVIAVLAIACYSESGTIAGPWVQEPQPFLAHNSGRGMLFRTFDGEFRYIVHHSEGNGPRKPQYWTVDDSGDKFVLGHQITLVCAVTICVTTRCRN